MSHCISSEVQWCHRVAETWQEHIENQKFNFVPEIESVHSNRAVWIPWENFLKIHNLHFNSTDVVSGIIIIHRCECFLQRTYINRLLVKIGQKFVWLCVLGQVANMKLFASWWKAPNIAHIIDYFADRREETLSETPCAILRRANTVLHSFYNSH